MSICEKPTEKWSLQRETVLQPMSYERNT